MRHCSKLKKLHAGRLFASGSIVVATLLCAMVTQLLVPAVAHAVPGPTIFNFSDGNRMAIFTCDLLMLTEGNFGSLVMVAAGIGALIASAGGNYKTGYSLLAVAVFAFTLRAGLNIFFDHHLQDCPDGNGLLEGRSAQVLGRSAGDGGSAAAAPALQNRVENYWNSIDTREERVERAPLKSAGSDLGSSRRSFRVGRDAAGAQRGSRAAVNTPSQGEQGESGAATVAKARYDCALEFKVSPQRCVPANGSVEVQASVVSGSGGSCWPCNLTMESADLGYHSDVALGLTTSDVVGVPATASGSVTFTAAAYGCGPTIPSLPAKNITLPVCTK